MATATVSASGTNSFLARPGSRMTGSSTAMVVRVEARTGSATALVPSQRRLESAKPHQLVAVDRLQHHHRVVHQAAPSPGSRPARQNPGRLTRRR